MAEPTDEEIVENEDDTTDGVEEENESEREAGAPPVRKSAAYFVGLRQGKKAAKKELESEHSEDEELTLPAQNAIRKELQPFIESSKKQLDDIEVREYLSDNPDLKKHEKEIRRKMEAWPDVPVSEIAKTIDRTEERKEHKERVESRVRGTRLAGTSGGATEPKLPSSQEDMKAMYDRVKKGRETIDLKQFANE
jgi:hypothetical protein